MPLIIIYLLGKGNKAYDVKILNVGISIRILEENYVFECRFRLKL